MKIFIINLSTATQRRQFQKKQMSKLDLDYEFLEATSIHDISDETYAKHFHDWQRPLRNTEVACYYSHRSAWEMVIKSGKPALILEDDAILSKYLPKLLDNLNDIDNSDLINLENRGRKKFVSRSHIDIDCNSKLLRLYQDRSGAAGYILWPTGSNKLIQHEKKCGIALADAHITACHTLKAHQIEPSPIIQADQCVIYGVTNAYTETASMSTINIGYKYKRSAFFIIKRALSQIKLAFWQLFILTKSKRRYISIRNSDFNV